MTRRPDLVDVWPFRVSGENVEVLLMRRAPGRVLPGLWQGVSGALEPGESIVAGAWRELLEETGFTPADVEAAYHLDHVAEFIWEPLDTLFTSVSFAFRLRPGRDPALSHEHDRFRWVPIAEALTIAVWPGYREALVRLRDNLFEPERSAWFELDARGTRTGPSAG